MAGVLLRIRPGPWGERPPPGPDPHQSPRQQLRLHLVVQRAKVDPQTPRQPRARYRAAASPQQIETSSLEWPQARGVPALVLQ